jgi:hypothetical protein
MERRISLDADQVYSFALLSHKYYNIITVGEGKCSAKCGANIDPKCIDSADKPCTYCWSKGEDQCQMRELNNVNSVFI